MAPSQRCSPENQLPYRTMEATLLAPMLFLVLQLDSKPFEELLRRAVVEEPRLRGAWVRFPKDQKQKLQLIVDAEQSATQVDLLKTLIAQARPRQRVEIDSQPILVPVSRLIRELQENLDADPQQRFDGCLIQGAYFTERSATGLWLNLYGRLPLGESRSRTDDLRVAIAGECKTLMEFDPVWAGLTAKVSSGTDEPAVAQIDLEINPDSLVPTAPREVAADLFYNRGIALFHRCQFREAARTFQLAYTDDPIRLEIKYWRIVCEIADGNENRAYRLLWPLVQRQRRGDNTWVQYRQVMVALERVQGPMRQALVGMESQAWASPVRPMLARK